MASSLTIFNKPTIGNYETTVSITPSFTVGTLATPLNLSVTVTPTTPPLPKPPPPTAVYGNVKIYDTVTDTLIVEGSVDIFGNFSHLDTYSNGLMRFKAVYTGYFFTYDTVDNPIYYKMSESSEQEVIFNPF